MRESTEPLTLADAAATEALGAALAAGLPDLAAASLVLHLQGDLGAGKTTLTRGFLRRLGVGGVVRSPTYTLVEPYALAGLICIHVDLYRLRDPQELDNLGLRDYLIPGHVVLIEWPQMGGAGVPAADLALHIDYDGSRRVVRLHPDGAVGQDWAARSLAALQSNNALK